MRWIAVAICSASVLGLGVARAAPLPPDAGVFSEVAGARSLGMGGAHRGLGTNNDTLVLNPAGMAVAKRYSIELNYDYDVAQDLSAINVSAVDSKSGPVAGGLGYTHLRGNEKLSDPSLHRVYVGAAYPITSSLAVGVTGRHVRGPFHDGDASRKVSLYTGDVGFLAMLGSGVGLGLTAHNVIKTDLGRMAPLLFGLGAAYSAGLLSLAGDLVLDSREHQRRVRTIHVGAEYFAGQAFPVRVGYLRRPFTTRAGESELENVITAGLAWVSSTGGFAASAERSVERTHRWQLLAAMQIYL